MCPKRCCVFQYSHECLFKMTRTHKQMVLVSQTYVLMFMIYIPTHLTKNGTVVILNQPPIVTISQNAYTICLITLMRERGAFTSFTQMTARTSRQSMLWLLQKLACFKLVTSTMNPTKHLGQYHLHDDLVLHEADKWIPHWRSAGTMSLAKPLVC